MSTHLPRTSRGVRILQFWFILLATVLAESATFAWEHAQRTIWLQQGQSTTVFDSREGPITIQCGNSIPPAPPLPPGGPGQPGYPGPGYPGYPDGSSCSTLGFDQKLQRLAYRRDLLARGECAFRRADGFMRCEGYLERHEVQSQKEAFLRELNELKFQVEGLCQTRQCRQFEVSRVLRDYDNFLSTSQFTRIIYERVGSVALIDAPEALRPNCSRW